jgi:hypothetical protein
MSRRTHVVNQPSQRNMERVLEVGKAIRAREVLVTEPLVSRIDYIMGITDQFGEVSTAYVQSHTERVFNGNVENIVKELFAIPHFSGGYMNVESRTALAIDSRIPAEIGQTLSSTLTLRRFFLHQWDASVKIWIVDKQGEPRVSVHQIQRSDVDLREFHEIIKEVIWFAQALEVNANTFGDWKQRQMALSPHPHLTPGELQDLFRNEDLHAILQRDGPNKFENEWMVNGMNDLFDALNIKEFENLTDILIQLQAEDDENKPSMEYVAECAVLMFIIARKYSVFIYEELANLTFEPDGPGAILARSEYTKLVQEFSEQTSNFPVWRWWNGWSRVIKSAVLSLFE